MADKKRLLDVWILEINKVYREVPFEVVTDWLQQGRLLPEDKVRVVGGKSWHACAAVPAFAPFLPRPEPLAVSDTASALERVDLGFVPTRRIEDEDEDVDMIPLIDISLVLLIFFMMTATVNSGILTMINTPGAKHQLATAAAGAYWVGIDTKSGGGQIEKGPDGKPLPWFSMGKGNQELVKPTIQVSEVLETMEKSLSAENGEITVGLRADRGLPIETIKSITLELQGLENNLNRRRDQGQGKLRLIIMGEVSEPRE